MKTDMKLLEALIGGRISKIHDSGASPIIEVEKEGASFFLEGGENPCTLFLRETKEESQDEDTRNEAISFIEGLYPTDAFEYPATVEVGNRLLCESCGEDWRNLPTEMLLKLRDANEREENAAYLRFHAKDRY